MLPFSKNGFQSATFEWPKDAINGRSVYVIKNLTLLTLLRSWEVILSDGNRNNFENCYTM